MAVELFAARLSHREAASGRDHQVLALHNERLAVLKDPGEVFPLVVLGEREAVEPRVDEIVGRDLVDRLAETWPPGLCKPSPMS
jgi:hypothetical protein